MSLSLQTNYSSLVTQDTLRKTESALDNALERLSTGYRINSAADDAAGMQIASRLSEQISGMGVASRNSQDGISMIQTAGSIFSTLTSMTQDMNDLAIQGLNGSNSVDDMIAISGQITELSGQFKSIFDNADYAGQSLFGKTTALGGDLTGFASVAGITYQSGITAAEIENVTVNSQANALLVDYNGVADAVAAAATSVTSASAEENIAINSYNQVIAKFDDLLTYLDTITAGSDLNYTAITTEQQATLAQYVTDINAEGKAVEVTVTALGSSGDVQAVFNAQKALFDSQVVGLLDRTDTLSAGTPGTTLDLLEAALGGTLSAGDVLADFTGSEATDIANARSTLSNLFNTSTDVNTLRALFTEVLEGNGSSTNGAMGMLDSMGAIQAVFGANINKLEANIDNLGSMVQNLSSARGRIQDTDYAVESANLSKNQMLMQSGMQMLKVSDQIGQLTLSLLQ